MRNRSPILVTGAAGFIGFHLAQKLLDQGRAVIGFDNLSDYYSVALKEARLKRLAAREGFRFVRGDIADAGSVEALFVQNHFELVFNMAAQAGVRYSLVNPQAYVSSNLVGFANLLEACRHAKIKNLIYASSSSVYGATTRAPFSTDQNVDHPLSIYAATKKANELLAHSYSHLFSIPTTGVRFFTVYGPWGRPDMALFKFTESILKGQPIEVFNHGEMERDFTYVDDVVEALVRLGDRPATANPDWNGDAPDPSSSRAPYRIYNVGNHAPVKLTRMIEVLEQKLERTATKTFLPMQAGDVPATYADVADLARDVGFAPRTSIEIGIGRFVDWYRDFYKV